MFAFFTSYSHSIKEVNKRDHALGREGKGWSLENNTY